MNEKIKKLDHWRCYQNPKYIGAYAFQPNEHKILTIKSKSKEIVETERGQEECFILYFEENEKPLICKPTNCKLIESSTGTPYPEQWISKKIELYVTKVKSFGKMVDAVRVMPTAPIIKKEKLKQDSERWHGAVQAIKDKKITIEKISKLFEITEDDLKELEFQATELVKIELEENNGVENEKLK